ncbi:MAG: hypothetical protein IPG50_26645 [Myxococcales bacterium]|nr:hypothetical protein [Myxococcales bacterium]
MIGKAQVAAALAKADACLEANDSEGALRAIGSVLRASTYAKPIGLEVASSLLRTFRVAWAAKRYADGERAAYATYSIRVRQLAPDDDDLATAMLSVAMSFDARGAKAVAADFMRKAMCITEKALGLEHERARAIKRAAQDHRREFDPALRPGAPGVYELDTRGASGNPDLAFVADIPAAVARVNLDLLRVGALGKRLPKGVVFTARPKASLPTPVVGNKGSLLLVHEAVKAVFDATGAAFESSRVEILTSQRKPISREHFLIHPLTLYECRHAKARHDPESLESLYTEDLVVDAKAAKKAPPLFRIPRGGRELPYHGAFVNEEVAEALYRALLPHVYLVEVRQSPRPRTAHR